MFLSVQRSFQNLRCESRLKLLASAKLHKVIHGYNLFAVYGPLFRQTREYSEEVLDHFEKPRNVGSFQNDDPAVGTAIVGKASCGDVIKLQVKIKDGVIEDAKFKAFGCGSAIASTSFATELIKGKSCCDALKIQNSVIADHLSLPPVKLHCSLLAEDAIKHAIQDYQRKNEINNTESRAVSN